MEKRRTFAQESVLCASPCVRIKRESGANPGQSRCCDAPWTFWKSTITTGHLFVMAGKVSERGRVRRPAVH